jgi:hypothetical protein
MIRVRFIFSCCLVFLLPPSPAWAGEKMEIERGLWSTEDAKIPHKKNYRQLCVDGLEFLSVEGYGGGQSSSTSVHIVQVLDKTGKPKICK